MHIVPGLVCCAGVAGSVGIPCHAYVRYNVGGCMALGLHLHVHIHVHVLDLASQPRGRASR